MNGRFTLVDVGARGGLPWHWAKAGRSLHVIAFEPDVDAARLLAAEIEVTGATADVIPAAVWDRRGAQTLHLTAARACSSVYPPNTDFLAEFPHAERFAVTERVPLEAITLDEAVAGRNAGPPRFIKLDAQGGALPILQGADRALSTAIGLELEVEFIANYEGEPLFGDVDRHVRDRGFELVDLRPTYWRRASARSVAGTRGQLIFADALYLLSPSRLAIRLAGLSPSDAAHLAASAIVACDVYRLPDWVVAYAHAARGIDGEAAEQLRAAEGTAARSGGLARLPDFPGRLALGFWLKDLADRLIESASTWAPAETRLGGRPRLRRGIFDRLFGRGA